MIERRGEGKGPDAAVCGARDLTGNRVSDVCDLWTDPGPVVVENVELA